MKKQTYRKIISLILVITFIFALIPAVSVNAAEEFVIDRYGVLTRYNGDGGVVKIPDRVKAIGNRAFFVYKRYAITEVIIPEGVTSIEEGAFMDCEYMTKITIPNSVANIKQRAFEMCYSLLNIKLPNSINSIEPEVFVCCASLIEINIPNSVTSIGENAFSGCDNLINVAIPNSVTSIGDEAFSSCKSLRSITVPNSVTNIGKDAFNNDFLNNVIVCCEANSYALKYAQENDIRYIIGKQDYSKPNQPAVTTVYTEDYIKKTGDIYENFPVRSVFYSDVPNLQTIINEDGSISVFDKDNVKIYEYSSDMTFIKTLKFTKELEKVGAFTKDNYGNYYIFYGKDVDGNGKTEKNMALVKYSPSGEKLLESWQQAYDINNDNDVMKPFDAGTCRLEISGDMIAVCFARQMFNGHQAQSESIFNINTFEKLSGRDKMGVLYVSHSFNQFILPINKGFAFAGLGDGYPRAFSFGKTVEGQPGKVIDSFAFSGDLGENYTGAELGGLAKTPKGYIFAGTYERKNPDIISSRNLFLQIINEDMTTISDPIWITNYDDRNSENAVSPQIVQIDESKYLLLWGKIKGERTDIRTIRTYMAIVNDKGEIITPAKEILGVTLNGEDVLRYNPKTGLVYWATCEIDALGEWLKSAIKLYALDPYAEPHYAPPLNVGEPIGDVLYSDITAYINGQAIPTSVINGKTLVVVEDLANYGFDVVWNGKAKTLKVELNKNKTVNPLKVSKENKPVGTFKEKYVYTDIKTYLSGKQAGSFAINGRTLIDFELLSKYGSISWNGKTREIRLVIK